MISNLLVAALFTSSAWAIPPESFGFPSAPNDTALVVQYPNGGNATTVSEGSLFGIDVPAQQPAVAVDTAMYRSLADYQGEYLLLMVDPDATTPQNPSSRFILHWAQPSMTASGNMPAPSGLRGQMLTNRTTPLVPYRRPGPPPNSDPHRYILYAFQQPQDFTWPSAFAGFNAMSRTNFNLTEFISAARLDAPAAANYYFCTNKTDVPADFIAQPGGMYPGGNGAAITEGPGPSPSATASGSPSGSSSAPAYSTSAAATVVDARSSTGALLGAVGAWLLWAL